MKKVFLVYGHYNDKSFNAAIKEEFINTVKENGKPSSNNCTCNMYNICVYNGQQT